jgi:hypothetical protein
VEPEALTPDEECRHHESVTWASMSTVSPLTDKQHCHEAADRPVASDDAVIECIRTEFALCAAPLDAILAEIACEEAAFETTLSTSYLDITLSNMGGGAHSRLCPLLSCLRLLYLRLYHRLRPTANSERFIPVPDLAVALVDATSLEHPVLLAMWLPPTQNFCRGGIQRQLQPCWHERPHLVARWCHHLRPPILPPSIPLHSVMELFFLPGEGTPIHSMREDFLFPRGSARNASTDHIVLAGVINLALPTNLLDGLRWGGAVFIVLVLSFGRFLPFFSLVFLS